MHVLNILYILYFNSHNTSAIQVFSSIFLYKKESDSWSNLTTDSTAKCQIVYLFWLYAVLRKVWFKEKIWIQLQAVLLNTCGHWINAINLIHFTSILHLLNTCFMYDSVWGTTRNKSWKGNGVSSYLIKNPVEEIRYIHKHFHYKTR